MRHKVFLTKAAVKDINDIFSYIELGDSESKAHNVLNEIETRISSLEMFPSRGRKVEELSVVGIVASNIKQISFKPYRIVYKIDGLNVYVLMVLDGRRDLDEILIDRTISL